jgi:hypothetical protein
MEEDTNKIYEALLKLNRRVAELDQRNAEIEAILSTFNPTQEKEGDRVVIDEESTIIDPYNLESHKNVSLPNGGVIRVKSKSFCVNGRHIVNSAEDILFCSKCNAILCNQHIYGLDEPLCTACIKEEIKAFDMNSLFLLLGIKYNVPIRKIRRRLNISNSDIKTALSLLKAQNCITQDLFFRYKINIYGENVLNLATLLYDFSFLEPLF